MTELDPSFLATPIAHRALHDLSRGRPENSRAAIAAAIAAGYGIEIDLQASRDGQAMVFHDYDLKRLTGISGAVGARTAAELSEITLTGGDEGIPTLAEVLDQVRGRVPLLIELKDQDGLMGTNVGALEAATAEALRAYPGPVALMSFNPHSVAALARLAPDVPRGLTTCDFAAEDWPTLPAGVRAALRAIPDVDRVGATFISHVARDLDSPRVAEIQASGRAIFTWTIRSPAEEQTARQIADNITFEGYLATLPG